MTSVFRHFTQCLFKAASAAVTASNHLDYVGFGNMLPVFSVDLLGLCWVGWEPLVGGHFLLFTEMRGWGQVRTPVGQFKDFQLMGGTWFTLIGELCGFSVWWWFSLSVLTRLTLATLAFICCGWCVSFKKWLFKQCFQIDNWVTRDVCVLAVCYLQRFIFVFIRLWFTSRTYLAGKNKSHHTANTMHNRYHYTEQWAYTNAACLYLVG